MSPRPLQLVSKNHNTATQAAPTLAQTLTWNTGIDPAVIANACARVTRRDASFTEALLADGLIDNADLAGAEAQRLDSRVIDVERHPPDARLIDQYGAARVLRDRVLPWRKLGGITVIAVSNPRSFRARRPELEDLFGPVAMAIADDESVSEALLTARRRALAHAADTRVAEAESCRDLWSRKGVAGLSLGVLALFSLCLWQPLVAVSLLTGWAVFTLVLTSGLRAAAAIAQFAQRDPRSSAFATSRTDTELARLPKVSLLVPLFHERQIAEHLLKRLEALDYPRELLDVCLIAEHDDTITQDTIKRAGLPPWVRLISVPPGGVQTKPRALNYALDFTKGAIIGVYDAEDAPAPDQIIRVVDRFAQCRPDVVCLQGMLDFYNPRDNWLSRCFTVDYATWFRIILPGLNRLGLVIPLGGTTVFFRRNALETLGGWDAHNVTEDADLGIRLARRGFRTELIHTTTGEEANCRPWAWVRQRSRWLKGYAVTYATHMRSPRRLLSDLGPWRFFGVQVLLLGTLSQFLLAPLLWTFWMLPLGLAHPLSGVLSWPVMVALAAVFLLSEAINIVLGCVAVSGRRHRWLMPWVPTLHFYWPMGALASYKALWELVTKPFFWDKTDHGLSTGPPFQSSASTASASRLKRVSNAAEICSLSTR